VNEISSEPPEPDTSAPDTSTPVAAAPVSPTAAPEPPDADAIRLAEALLFASAGPVTARALSQVLPADADADAVLTALAALYAGRGVEVVTAGGGVMFRTAADLAPRLRKVVQVPRRLPRAAMETLAIVAYHQPVTRPEIEEIRGTSLSQQTLDSLLEAGLIAPRGRKESPGRPTLWATTPNFLAQFGLKDLRELPRREDLLVEPPSPADRAELAAGKPDSPTQDHPIEDDPTPDNPTEEAAAAPTET
jgi:segregation and condensation protein B